MRMDPTSHTLMLNVLVPSPSVKHHPKLNLAVEWIFMMSSTHLSLWRKRIRPTSMERTLALIWERLNELLLIFFHKIIRCSLKMSYVFDGTSLTYIFPYDLLMTNALMHMVKSSVVMIILGCQHRCPSHGHTGRQLNAEARPQWLPLWCLCSLGGNWSLHHNRWCQGWCHHKVPPTLWLA